MQQTDVKATHISVSGLMENGRTRIKQFTFVGTAGQSGKFAIFDSLVAPVTSGTYAQSGTTTVTVTKTAQGGAAAAGPAVAQLPACGLRSGCVSGQLSLVA